MPACSVWHSSTQSTGRHRWSGLEKPACCKGRLGTGIEQQGPPRQTSGPRSSEPHCKFCCAAHLSVLHLLGLMAQRRRFVNCLKANMSSWNVKYWCATFETCKSGRLHVHLMVQFWAKQDRSSCAFAFEGINPEVNARNYLGEGVGRQNPQQSIDGFFCVFEKKLRAVVDEGGHECVTGNYVPTWCSQDGAATYRVQGKWPEALWKHYKLDHATYEEYLFLTRDGVQARKRNLDACKAWSETQTEEAEIAATVKWIRSSPPLYKFFPAVPTVSAWLEHFKTDLLRYPLLTLLGASASGKTEYAKSLFHNPLELKVGSSEVFPAKMVEFKRGVHDALILGDVHDLDFLASHQEKVQGKYDSRIEFATTQGGTCFYTKYLLKVPTVVTEVTWRPMTGSVNHSIVLWLNGRHPPLRPRALIQAVLWCQANANNSQCAWKKLGLECAGFLLPVSGIQPRTTKI